MTVCDCTSVLLRRVTGLQSLPSQRRTLTGVPYFIDQYIKSDTSIGASRTAEMVTQVSRIFESKCVVWKITFIEDMIE
jgi:hypothetical protein